MIARYFSCFRKKRMSRERESEKGNSRGEEEREVKKQSESKIK